MELRHGKKNGPCSLEMPLWNYIAEIKRSADKVFLRIGLLILLMTHSVIYITWANPSPPSQLLKTVGLFISGSGLYVGYLSTFVTMVVYLYLCSLLFFLYGGDSWGCFRQESARLHGTYRTRFAACLSPHFMNFGISSQRYVWVLGL